MRLHHPSIALLWAAVFGVCVAAKEAEKTTTTAPCTARSTNEAFFDLRPDIAIAHEEGERRKAFRSVDYTARGYDYPANFTLNICAPVIKPPKEAEGISDKLLRNVSAYYEKKGKTYSLGCVLPIHAGLCRPDMLTSPQPRIFRPHLPRHRPRPRVPRGLAMPRPRRPGQA